MTCDLAVSEIQCNTQGDPPFRDPPSRGSKSETTGECGGHARYSRFKTCHSIGQDACWDYRVPSTRHHIFPWVGQSLFASESLTGRCMHINVPTCF